jgi:hypothetical protein
MKVNIQKKHKIDSSFIGNQIIGCKKDQNPESSKILQN